jgi:hypothetical protein
MYRSFISGNEYSQLMAAGTNCAEWREPEGKMDGK